MFFSQTLLHTAFTSGFVSFDGPHSCKIDAAADVPKGVTDEIKNSQGVTIQDGGIYASTRLPTEPLAIARAFLRFRAVSTLGLALISVFFADFLQRDLSDCHSVRPCPRSPASNMS
jgi:hypothetical protein